MGVVSRGKAEHDNEDWIIRDVLAAQERGSDAPDHTRESGAMEREQDQTANTFCAPAVKAKALNPDPFQPKDADEKPAKGEDD